MKEITVTVDGNQFTIDYDSDRKLFIDKKAVETTIKNIDDEIFQLTFEQKIYNIWIERIDETHYNIWIDHHVFNINIEDKQNGHFRINFKKFYAGGENLSHPGANAGINF